jgi:hypothetical protein
MYEKYVKILMFLLVFTAYFAIAAPQEVDQLNRAESLVEKYQGYKTTIESSEAVFFERSETEFEDLSPRGREESKENFIDFSVANAGSDYQDSGSNYQALYNDLFKQEDFSQGGLQDLTRQFQAQYQQMLTQPDALYKELSVKPYQSQQTYRNPAGNNSANRSDSSAQVRQKTADTGSGYDAEQPAVIAWVFSVIRYVREHPLISGAIALALLGVFSLIQIVIRRFARPFG